MPIRHIMDLPNDFYHKDINNNNIMLLNIFPNTSRTCPSPR
jgi:hypothetical protein